MFSAFKICISIVSLMFTAFLIDLEKILEQTSGKYCVGDEVGHFLWGFT